MGRLLVRRLRAAENQGVMYLAEGFQDRQEICISWMTVEPSSVDA